jgi:hypothetical protein
MNPYQLPDNAHLAALRAWYEGTAARQAVSRYLPHLKADGQSSRAMLGRIRQQLAGYARLRHRDDLAALFSAVPAQREGKAKVIANAIEQLRHAPVPQPIPRQNVAGLAAIRERPVAELGRLCAVCAGRVVPVAGRAALSRRQSLRRRQGARPGRKTARRRDTRVHPEEMASGARARRRTRILAWLERAGRPATALRAGLLLSDRPARQRTGWRAAGRDCAHARPTARSGSNWLGKGNKPGAVYVPPGAYHALESDLAWRGLPTLASRWDPNIHLLGAINDDAGSITAGRLWAITRRFFETAAKAVENVCPHWPSSFAARVRTGCGTPTRRMRCKTAPNSPPCGTTCATRQSRPPRSTCTRTSRGAPGN